MTYAGRDSTTGQFVSTQTIPERFWSKVKCPTGIGECWKWLALKYHGYGAFARAEGGHTRAHRFAYEQVFGKIPDGLVIDHLCNNPGCVNPYHLKAVTNKENVFRSENFIGQNVRKTHCPKGHPLSGNNLIRGQLRVGKRQCKTCFDETRKRYKERKRGEG